MSTAELAPTPTSVRGRYLYAIIDGRAGQAPLGLTGLEDQAVYTLGDDELAAVVSDLPTQKLRPERRRLAAHHQVLKQLMMERTVLPMVFGLIAESAEAVQRILTQNRSSFRTELDRVRGKVEMGVRVAWDVPNIFEFLIGMHPDLKAQRDHLFRGAREPSYDEKIELGRLFNAILEQERDDQIERIRRVIEPHCVEIAVNHARQEKEVVNMACLVDRLGLKEFEASVIDVAKRYDQHYAFDISGPWPPHNFVAIDLQW